VLYTDGVPEASGPGDNSYGEARLQQVVEQAARRRSAQEVVSAILASVDEFRGTLRQSDDITLVVMLRE